MNSGKVGIHKSRVMAVALSCLLVAIAILLVLGTPAKLGIRPVIAAESTSRDRYGDNPTGRGEFYKAPYYTQDANGNWVSYVFTEESDNYKVQAARASVRFYDYYTEVWTEDFSSILINDDRWVVQYFGKNKKWTDADFYRVVRSYQIVSPDELIVKRTGNTDIGQRVENYIFKAGEPCKIKIEQTCDQAQTIRFIWKPSGIVAASETAEYTESGKQQGLAYYDSNGNFVTRFQWFNELNICSSITPVCESGAQGRKATITFGDFNVAAGATQVLDPLYEYYNTGDDDFIPSYDGRWLAQTFTPSVAHTIASVKLKLSRYGSPGTVTVGIKATDGSGHPTGSDLCSGTIDGNSLTTVTTGAWYEITLGSGYALSASTKYAIVLRAPNGDSSNQCRWRRDISSPTYAGGCYEYSTDSGSTWTSYDYDTMFEEWSGEPNISVSPTSYDFGTLAVSTTADTGLTYFTITNTGTCTVDITIGGTDMTGGGYTWTLSDSAIPGDMTYGMKAGLEGGDYTIIVKKTTPYNTLKSGLAVSGTQKFGLKLYTPTGFSDNNAKSGTVTLTAVCSS
jgi:hypothetical protein